MGYERVAVTDSISRAEEQILESEARFRLMADYAPVLLWLSGRDALCTFFNEGWLAFRGRTMDQELGNGWAEGVHPEDFKRCLDVYMSSFADRRAFRMEYRLRRADGEYRWILDTGVPRYTPTGTFEGYVGSCIDVTEFKEARDELDRLVRDRTAELEAFTFSVSHDLRAPLRHIEQISQWLIEDCNKQLDERGRDYLERICKGTRRMSDLIDGLLRLSRIGRAELRLETVSLSAIARSVLAAMAERERDRQVETIIAEDVAVHGDPDLLRIALENLIGNAWKFTSKTESARIELGKTVAEDRTAIVFIRDNGAGFDMTSATKLFTPFQRLHIEADFSGTGIGLATVQRIITCHGGRIWAQGALGEGATFLFTLPEQRREPATVISHSS